MGPCLRSSFYNQYNRPTTSLIYNVVAFTLALTTISTAHISRYLSLKGPAMFRLSLIALLSTTVSSWFEKRKRRRSYSHIFHASAILFFESQSCQVHEWLIYHCFFAATYVFRFCSPSRRLALSVFLGFCYTMYIATNRPFLRSGSCVWMTGVVDIA